MPPAALLALWFSMITTKSLVGFPTGVFVPVDSVGELVDELDEDPDDGLLLPLEQPAANSNAARLSVATLTDVLTKVPHRSIPAQLPRACDGRHVIAIGVAVEGKTTVRNRRAGRSSSRIDGDRRGGAGGGTRRVRAVSWRESIASWSASKPDPPTKLELWSRARAGPVNSM
jgi:hypothetical protein